MGETKASQHTLEILGNLQIEKSLDGKRHFLSMDLINPKADEFSEALEELSGFHAEIFIEDLVDSSLGVELDLRFLTLGHIKRINLTTRHFDLQYASDTNPRELK